MFQRGWFLVGTADLALRQHVTDVVQRYGVARALHVGPTERARELLSEPGRVAGVVLEADDRACASFHEVRAMAPSVPILALQATPSWHFMNTAQVMGVEVAMLPVHEPNLVSFVQRSLSASCIPHDGVARVVMELARARTLSAREVQLLSFALANESRARVRRRLGISENTLKTQIRALLRKCDERNLDSLAKNVLRAALLVGRPRREPISPWWPAEARADSAALAQSA